MQGILTAKQQQHNLKNALGHIYSARSAAMCHRCGKTARKKGRMSASVAGERGGAVRRYICAGCVVELRDGWRALYHNALAAEREENRADRRAA
jgi:late competence protein required for DNA uptake (superfamily II DNA/RNA helicase)